MPPRVADSGAEKATAETFRGAPHGASIAATVTGLRPVTLERIEVGRNWHPKADTLRLTDEDDKAEYGREFPLTKMAVEILTRVFPKAGHVWGHHDRRKFVRAAAAIVFAKDPHRAAAFGSYHLRHFVGTFLANRAGTNLAAAQYVMGHLDLTTTSVYVRADADGARELLNATEGEMRKAARAAETWARKEKRIRNSVPIRSRSA